MIAPHATAFRYTPPKSTATTVAGFGDPNNVGGQPPIAAFFMSVMPSHASFHGGPGGAALGLAGANVPVRQPHCLARHPSFGDERRVSTTNVGGRAMRLNSLAHTGQIQSQEILALIRSALRDAVAAPSDCDGLDIAGAALVAVAALVKEGSRA
ncbi:hypothetical protein K6V90_26100 [Cupriavidus pauculus]|uniref:hypothetical protein n=1 Tax=Cupriavidus pauculus TaxID=82633 RepID=UPI001C934240|nr:hypothetical protein [Cupriavidus pauculus]MBY4734017.1 hypothetical protein [Cupriavidus pauculus]